MGDRTSVQLHFYSCPPEQTWAIANVIEEYGLTEMCGDSYRTGGQGNEKVGPGPWDLGHLEPGEQYLGNEVGCGSAEEIADFLQKHAPDARWDVWEDPKYEWMGLRYIYDPDLGLWAEQCDAEGTPRFTPKQVTDWVARAMEAGAMARRPDMEAAAAELAVERGEPWLELGQIHTDKRIVPIRGYDHDARPDDMPEPGDRCKDCGEPLIWMGPGMYDWFHVDDPRND